MTIFWRVFLKLKKTLTKYISEAQMKTVQRLQIIKRVVIHTRLKGSITVMDSRYLKPTKRCSIIRHRCLISAYYRTLRQSFLKNVHV